MNAGGLAETRRVSHLTPSRRRSSQPRYLVRGGRRRLRPAAVHRRLPQGRRGASLTAPPSCCGPPPLLPEPRGPRERQGRGSGEARRAGCLALPGRARSGGRQAPARAPLRWARKGPAAPPRVLERRELMGRARRRPARPRVCTERPVDSGSGAGRSAEASHGREGGSREAAAWGATA